MVRNGVIILMVDREWVVRPLFYSIYGAYFKVYLRKGLNLMAKAETVLEKIAAPVCEEYGLSVYDAEYVKEGGQFYLRLYIDKEGGVTIDDCERVSMRLNEVLDREMDFLKDAYIFEVSSPGLNRKIRLDRHFQSAVGKNVDIKTFAPFRGSKAFTAKLLGYDHGIISLELDGERVLLEKGKTSSIRLTVEI